MTKKEIYEEEENNYSRIILRKEGIFWKAYNHSACILCNQVRPYKVAVNYFESVVGDAVFSVGFPCSALEKHIRSLKVLRMNSEIIELEAPKSLSNYDYNNWTSVTSICQ